MIKDVQIKSLALHHDDRGFFTEVVKFGEKIFHEVKQTSYTETHPGVIKAFHWHKKQWDIWFVSRGSAQVVLNDLRKKSPTKGQTDVFYIGEKNPIAISIPPGVAHGYRVLGNEKVGLFYHTTRPYEAAHPDEERIPFDSPLINFDWRTKNK